MSDSRTGKRFPLQLPIKIKDESAAALRKGLTSNVSAAGVYVKANGEFHIGSRVQFDITLPAGVIGTKEDVEIQCRGRVVRLDNKEAGKKSKAPGSGMACVIDHYKFVRR